MHPSPSGSVLITTAVLDWPHLSSQSGFSNPSCSMGTADTALFCVISLIGVGTKMNPLHHGAGATLWHNLDLVKVTDSKTWAVDC